jgi:D-aminopeptidase
MRVVLSIDMEGISQLAAPREILSCRPEYWATGKPRMEADTAAAAQGLLDAGADEVIVLDNHGSGNPENVSPDSLPAGCRLETWNVFDLPQHAVDAMFQVGYHARGGTDGFISHTYVPGLRFRVGEELISESHGRAWAAAVPLIGITGNDTHRDTLGSLADTPYLVVQETLGRESARPVFADRDEGLGAIRAFAARCLGDLGDIRPPQVPDQPLFRGQHAERRRAGQRHGGSRVATNRRGRVRSRAEQLERGAGAAGGGHERGDGGSPAPLGGRDQRGRGIVARPGPRGVADRGARRRLVLAVVS